MTTGYSRSPKLLKGALVQFSAPLLVPIPNIIVFQYNPETMTRTVEPWTPPDSSGQGEKAEASDDAQPTLPDESFSLSLELDATDALEEPDSHPVAVISGVADRIAALEMLLYPAGGGLLGDLLGSIDISISVGVGGSGASLDASASAELGLARDKVPVVLFVWGPGRIVPVRLTSFSVEEQAFSPILYPIRAKVSVGMKVLKPEVFEKCDKTLSEELAIAAYKFTQAQKEVLALANLANSVESILGMLP